MLKKAAPYWPLILLLAIIKFLLPIFLQHPVYELQRDEFLYFQQGQHPAFGYLENPPLIGWLATISGWMGHSAAWVKLWPCLFGAGTVVLACLIAAEMGGKLFAQFVAGFSIISGAFVRTHYLFQPNFLDIFFWTLALYALVCYLRSGDPRFIPRMIVVLALGWYGKYSVLFMIAGIATGLLMTPQRRVLFQKKSFQAMLVAALIVLPNLIWQYEHKWPLIHHMEELRDTQLRYISKSDFIKEQFLLLLPVLLIWLGGLIWVLRQQQWRAIGYIYFTVILLLLFGSGKGYYALGLYPVLLAAGSVAWEQWLQKQVWARYVLAGLIIAFNILLLPLLLPTRSPEKLAALYKKVGVENKWEDQQLHPLPQDFADMLGWKETTEKAERFFMSLPDSTRQVTWILTDHYGQAGALQFYGTNQLFRSHTITGNGSFRLWIPNQLAPQHIIYIGHEPKSENDPVFGHFMQHRVIDSVTNPYSRQYGDKITWYEHLDETGLQNGQKALQALKAEFQR